jgi:DNA-binding beta-propeller fold protein YncE
VGAELRHKVPASANPYTLFETGQVRPLAMSPSGRLLFACNTPDNRLEIFRFAHGTPVSLGSITVGLEPLAVAARSEDEVWVVNHLSDSVSIIDVGDGAAPRLKRTLWVGDEPRDIVFGGPAHDLAFITTAHRGQSSADDPDLFQPGANRADVWVFDARNLGSSAGGTRLTKLTFFADTPRALAVSPDGSRVYAAAFLSGNQTTTVSVDAVKQVYGGVMPPPSTVGPFPQPPTGLIVKYRAAADGTFHWLDAYGSVFDAWVKVQLPDLDVFAIDATVKPPVALATGAYAHVGTVLFNMAVNPVNGKVYVSNTEARNDVRFEGHVPGVSSVRGHITDSRVTVIDPASGAVAAHDLNTHVDYTVDSTPGEKEKSVAFPQDLVVSRDGSTLYVVAQGSSKLAVYQTSDIENGTITPSLSDQVVLSGGGPAGVVLDERRGQAYVLTRFDNGLSVVNLSSKTEVKHVTMFNPEPASVTNGRRYLYDATLTSQHGVTACASCHIAGDLDGLAWDLGNPGGIPLPITPVFAIPEAAILTLLPETAPEFQAFMQLKGPMTTQSLRGMDNHGAMHWRGDRNGSFNQDGSPVIDAATGMQVVSAQPNGGIFDEFKAFTSFNVAFPGLVGDSAQLSTSDMNDFATFILQNTYPPNPIRNLDNSLTAEQAAGRAFYFNAAPDGTELPSDRFHNCAGCHTLDPKANAGATAHPGFFGTSGLYSFENETQIFKVPHLRNLYQKVGMFSSSPDSLQPGTQIPELNPVVPAVRGFGFTHDGSLGSLEHFFMSFVFLKFTTPVPLPNGNLAPPNPYGIPFQDPATGQLAPEGFVLRHEIVSFLLAYDSNLAPIVGQQVTLTSQDRGTANARIDLLEARANAGECDLVVKGHFLNQDVGWLYTNGAFQFSYSSVPPLGDQLLRGLASDWLPLTYTCVPPGEGARVALDRDGDGWADGDELAAGSNPADPNSTP